LGRAAGIGHPVAPSAAASDLYERFGGQIFGYCLHQLGSREEAEDAVQTTFMNAFRGLQRGVVPNVESAWLFKIAHNVCLSRRRSTWRRGRVEAPSNLEVLQEVVPAREQTADELIRLQDVLEEMPEQQRRAILLREWQGLSYREIADELELSQSAVETLIFRARRALAAGLEHAPVRKQWRRLAHYGTDAGAGFTALKALLGGVTAKTAVTTVAVATTAAAVSGGQYYYAVHTRHVAHTPTRVAAHVVHSLQPARVVVRSVPARPQHVVSFARRQPRRAVTAPARTTSPPPRPASKPVQPVLASAPQLGAGPAPTPAPTATAEQTGQRQTTEASSAPPAPAPAVDAPQLPTAAQADPEAGPPESKGHGQETAPGQQDKDAPGERGNGHGNGHK
jgi:RNA polymerase sigma factor (sigma-70 family)